MIDNVWYVDNDSESLSLVVEESHVTVVTASDEGWGGGRDRGWWSGDLYTEEQEIKWICLGNQLGIVVPWTKISQDQKSQYFRTSLIRAMYICQYLINHLTSSTIINIGH